MKRTVLFLCTGDTCRGPMAAGLTGKLLLDIGVKDIDVRSAGVMTVNGLLATTETMQMLKGVGATLERHRSTPVSVELLRKCDLILGMTPLHVQHALRMAPDIKGRVFLLKEFARSDLKKVQIDDPMGNTLEVYKKVFSEIRGACQKFIKNAFVTGQEDKAAAAKTRKTAAKIPVKKVQTKKAAPKALAKNGSNGTNGASAGKKKAEKPVAAKVTVRKSIAAKTVLAPKSSRAKASTSSPPKSNSKGTGKTSKLVGKAR